MPSRAADHGTSMGYLNCVPNLASFLLEIEGGRQLIVDQVARGVERVGGRVLPIQR
jgi:hypothetical protein